MKKAGLVLFLSCAFVLSSRAQTFEAVLDTFNRKFPAEKLYLHYDKEFYVAGETIWFKAYLYNDGKPSGLSNNLFVQLIDSKGRLAEVRSFAIQGGVARGNIDLPDSLPQDTYCIRAFTPAMTGDDESFIYKKSLPVFAPDWAGAESKETENFTVQFFPESGELVNGILCVIGFKALNQSGMPVDVSGTIRTDDGTAIASFTSLHDGIGRVRFRPVAGKKYLAEVEAAAKNGILKKQFSLPVVRDSGVNLHVEDEKGGKKFQLSRNEKVKNQYETLWLVAQINNHVIYETEISFEEYPSVIGHLVTDSLPSGILHFVLMSKEKLPLAERLSFVNNGEYRGDAELSVGKANYTKRGENELTLTFPEGSQHSCSVAITDASGTGSNDKESIWSRLLLTSDLKGEVHNPAWYFKNPYDSVKTAIDNLLLTHGWSRFSWQKIMTGDFPETKRADRLFQVISGKVTDEKTKQPVEGGQLNIYLEGEDSVSLNFAAKVDTAGRFSVDSLIFYGKTKLFYAWQDNKGKQKPAVIIPDEDAFAGVQGFVPADISRYLPATARFANLKTEIKTRYAYVQSKQEEIKELERVTLSAKSLRKAEEIVNEKYAQGVFRAQSKVMLDNINEPVADKSLNAVDYIKNRIQQIELQGGQFVSRKNFSLGSGSKWPVGIFINEVPADLDQLRLLRTGEIAMVKFFDAGFVGAGTSAPGGTIAVYTKEESEAGPKPADLKSVNITGYSIVKEFYQPDYKRPGQEHTLADNRTTLYWNPDVFIDGKTNKFTISFFNNDFSKKFRIVVEGFDANGKLIHIEKITGSD